MFTDFIKKLSEITDFFIIIIPALCRGCTRVLFYYARHKCVQYVVDTVIHLVVVFVILPLSTDYDLSQTHWKIASHNIFNLPSFKFISATIILRVLQVLHIYSVLFLPELYMLFATFLSSNLFSFLVVVVGFVVTVVCVFVQFLFFIFTLFSLIIKKIKKRTKVKCV